MTTLTLHDYAVDEVLCIELAGYCGRMIELTGATNDSRIVGVYEPRYAGI